MHAQCSADRVAFRPRIVEGQLQEECYLEPIRQGSIYDRWQRDKRAAEEQRPVHKSATLSYREEKWLWRDLKMTLHKNAAYLVVFLYVRYSSDRPKRLSADDFTWKYRR
jgi:hypothetical protein